MENPTTYFPDYRAAPVPQLSRQYLTEIQTARSGREQRRRVNANPRRAIAYDTIPLEQDDRRVISDYLDARQGELEAFYFFSFPEHVSGRSAGTVSGETSIVLPWKGPWWIGETPVPATFVGATVGGEAPTDPVYEAGIGTGGEDRLSWTGAMSGEVLVTARYLRRRLTVRSAQPEVQQTFVPAIADALAVFALRFIELVS